MTLLSDGQRATEVGVRELHDHLSRYLKVVESGGEVIVTMRGKQVARLTGITSAERDPLAALRARGVIREPTAPRRPAADLPAAIVTRGSVSDLVSEQRD